MAQPIEVRFLRDVEHGGPPAQLADTAQALADFVSAATTSVDLAIYDFRLDDADAVSTVVGAFTAAANRGVDVRIGYDAGKPADATAETFALLGADPAPVGTADWVHQHFDGTGVRSTAIQGHGQLMHSKFVVRDAGTVQAAVWTGSANFTDDAWTRQENNVVIVSSTELAAGYRRDFDELWDAGSISGTGKDLGGRTTVDGAEVAWDFCPGDGEAINAALAARVAAAQERIVVAAMVLTSHEVLAALAAAVDRGVPVSGVYDGGQMDPIVAQWQRAGSTQVLAEWRRVAGRLSRKPSTPYSPTSVHDFMHLKVLLCDDVVVTGSYNFSANAQRNAENQMRVDHPATVAAFADYLTAVSSEYA